MFGLEQACPLLSCEVKSYPVCACVGEGEKIWLDYGKGSTTGCTIVQLVGADLHCLCTW